MSKEKESKISKSIYSEKGMRRSERVVHFATKVSPEWDNLIRQQAREDRCLLVEMLERYQQAYLEKLEREKKTKSPRQKK